MIVDTNGLSAWWLNEASFIRHVEHAERLCVPVPALAEFRFGILKSRFREKMMAWLDDALATTTVLAEACLGNRNPGTPLPSPSQRAFVQAPPEKSAP